MKNVISPLIVAGVIALSASSGLGMHSRLPGFSAAFVCDYNSAQQEVERTKSAEPLVALLTTYTNEIETAELDVSIGMLYNQRTGLVDPAKAIEHFTKALGHTLPDETYIEIILLRGNSREQLKQTTEAMQDYLRGLLACSYYDLSGEWPVIQSAPEGTYLSREPDPANDERLRDYHRYRKSVEFKQFLLMQRYYLIDAVKRVANNRPADGSNNAESLGKLTPDASRAAVISDWLQSENKRPWP